MPKFVSIETGNICGASRPANTPRQASAPAGKLLSGHSRPTPFRLDSLQSATLSGNYYFPPGASRPTAFRRISFHTSPHNLTLARNLHSGLTGQHASALILSLFFFYSTPFHTHPHTKKRKPAKPISISFSCNPKSSPNLVQAFPSQSLSLLFSPSNQYTLLHRPRSGHT